MILLVNMSLRDKVIQRSTAAIMWSIVFEALLLIIFMCVDINVLHPVTWIETLSKVFSFRIWLYFLPLAGITGAQGVMYSKKFMISSTFSGTRFAHLKNKFSFHNLLMGFICSLMSGAVTWTYLLVLRKEYRNITCKGSDENCFAEVNIFLTLNGFWSGTHFFLSNYIWDTNCVTFPVIQQLKFLQVKSELMSYLKQAMLKAIWPNIYFLIFYYWKGREINYFFNVHAEGNIGVTLLCHAWLLTTTFIFTSLITKHLLQIYLTEHWKFPVTAKLGDSDSTTLCQVLAMKQLPTIQNLGYFDLYFIAEKDYARRQDLFALSQPGGHPHNWNAVVQECLKVINNFTSELNKANFEISAGPNTSNGSVNLYQPSLVQETRQVLHTSAHSIRNLSMISEMAAIQHEQQLQIIPSATWDYICGVLKVHTSDIIEGLLKKPGIYYFFGSLPDAKHRYVLSQGLPVIWATQSIACLAAASLKEDSYGIVLKDLPSILTSLVQLKQVLDKIPKAGIYKRSQKIEQDDTKMKIAIKSAVKRSLYRICITFGESLKELDLPKTIHLQLQVYLSFREG